MKLGFGYSLLAVVLVVALFKVSFQLHKGTEELRKQTERTRPVEMVLQVNEGFENHGWSNVIFIVVAEKDGQAIAALIRSNIVETTQPASILRQTDLTNQAGLRRYDL